MDDSEDRQRRCNLVFYGFEDASDETWAQSEKRVMDLCLANMEVSVQPRDIERAHNIGRFQPSKNRPIIVRFCHFKDRELVLSNIKKLKDTNYSISEDLSPNTRKAPDVYFEVSRDHERHASTRIAAISQRLLKTSLNLFLRQVGSEVQCEDHYVTDAHGNALGAAASSRCSKSFFQFSSRSAAKARCLRASGQRCPQESCSKCTASFGGEAFEPPTNMAALWKVVADHLESIKRPPSVL
ncbi:hypothetical protein HPB51_002255 [Rhipicephalus microplus]|uniref:Uncharacterized protein n=1 Tax=Rhipicephalus microplus TaxID=6941 RepID=A0A9J6DY89_RHIMP|nr:hypothetical protein HPB51_002255 [Rhipicephalus microplus]